MQEFAYYRAKDVSSAVKLVGSKPSAQFIAGGTSQIDLMKEGVQRPQTLVDISRLPLRNLERTESGGVSIGANVSNAVAADHELLANYPAIGEALHAGASQQIRNVASMAGNLLQRTRCPYLRDNAQNCNKREPGSGCAATVGFNRLHAVFGQTDEGGSSPRTCIAVHPSDLAVALAAHEAKVVVHNERGERRIAFEDLHRLPGGVPYLDVNLSNNDLIVAIELPKFAGNSHYLKVRDRASYAYALVSCAVALEIDGSGRIAHLRIVLGSVAHKPWRSRAAEALLEGKEPNRELFRQAGAQAIEGAQAYSMNRFKIPLARELVERGLLETSGLEPLAGPAGSARAASVGGLGGLGGAV